MKSYWIVMIVLLVAQMSCGDDNETSNPQLKAPEIVAVRDISNFGSGQDIEIESTLPNEVSLVESYRIFVVKNGSASDFDSLAALESSHYSEMNVNDDPSLVVLDAAAKDVDGDVISEGQAYQIFVSAIGKDDLGLQLSNASSSITLKQESAVRTLTGIIEAGSGGMDLDKDGNIYMGDFGPTLSAGGANVYKITPDGAVSIFNNTLNGASGNDFDSDGNLYQSSTAGYMTKIATDGTSIVFASGFSGGLIGVSVQDDGRLYACNCGGNLIYEVSAEGDISTYVESDLFNCPNGIDVDDEGNLYIANFGNGDVVKITPNLEVSVLATIPGANNGHLLIHGDYIYVVARRGNSIYKVDFEGNASRFAGSGSRGISNGSLIEATFSLPNDIAISADGRKMYVNDVVGSDPNESIISPVVIREIDVIE